MIFQWRKNFSTDINLEEYLIDVFLHNIFKAVDK